MSNRIIKRQQLGRQIAELREQAEMSRYDLANKVGLKETHIKRIEKGAYSATFDTLQEIAEALGGNLVIIV